MPVLLLLLSLLGPLLLLVVLQNVVSSAPYRRILLLLVVVLCAESDPTWYNHKMALQRMLLPFSVATFVTCLHNITHHIKSSLVSQEGNKSIPAMDYVYNEWFSHAIWHTSHCSYFVSWYVKHLLTYADSFFDSLVP